jgi:hypothetical protein
MVTLFLQEILVEKVIGVAHGFGAPDCHAGPPTLSLADFVSHWLACLLAGWRQQPLAGWLAGSLEGAPVIALVPEVEEEVEEMEEAPVEPLVSEVEEVEGMEVEGEVSEEEVQQPAWLGRLLP